MVTVVPAPAVPAIMAIMGRRRIGRLWGSRIRGCLWIHIPSGTLLRGQKERRHYRQKEESNDSVHGHSPKRNPLCEY
jgi:hypothetical protein